MYKQHKKQLQNMLCDIGMNPVDLLDDLWIQLIWLVSDKHISGEGKYTIWEKLYKIRETLLVAMLNEEGRSL